MLDAYFDRIGFEGRARPDWETLDVLQKSHLAAIPFEAIDVLTGKPIDLTLPALVDKLVVRRRGGYCYEQNRLFEAVLREVGFDVRRVMARVLWHRPAGAPRPPRSHLALVVRLHDIDWLVDVGFGGSVPDRPLRLVADDMQQTRHDRFRFVRGEEGFLLTMYRDGSWRSAYEMTPGKVEDFDLEAANWYTSTHPDSGFRKALTVSLCTNEARHGLYGRQFSIRRPLEDVQTRELEPGELDRVLRDCFKLPSAAADALFDMGVSV